MEEIIELQYIDIEEKEEYLELLSIVAEECFKQEKIDKTQFYIDVTLTDDKNIRKINNQYRKIDKSTDVLSFPMFEQEELTKKFREKKEYQEVLGDVVISIETVQRQAIEFGHAFEREFAYMFVHSFYHLLGYDHMVEEEKIQMREKEDIVLDALNIKR